MIGFELDPAFADFNFSEWWDPALRKGPSASSLYKLVYRARNGDRFAVGRFADTMYCTLRPETWDCFQRVHGHRPVSHREWFYAKLTQFVDMLVFDQLTVEEPNQHPRKLQPDELLDERLTVVGGAGPQIQQDELEQALVPERHAEYAWYRLVQITLGNSTDRAGAVRAWLTEQRIAWREDPTQQPRGGWSKNQERDQIILNCLNRCMAPDAICDFLDKQTILTLPALKNKGIRRWKEGWDSLETRKAIQQLFSKVPKRKKPVKPPAVSN
jgi:hypothetical protein